LTVDRLIHYPTIYYDSLHYISNRFLFLCVELQGPVTDTLKVMDRQDLLLEDWEWETLAGAKVLLKPFDILTQHLSSQYYPSISKVLPSIRLLQKHLTEIHNHEFNDVLLMMCSSLNLNLKERFVDFYQNSCHIVSSYLDPRYDLLNFYKKII
jgi:hypothetical protein